MTTYEDVTPETLNSVMEFGHVIRVSDDGTVSDSPESPYMEASEVQDDDGNWHEEASLPEGWKLMHGYSGQYGYSGPVMHPSEFIGGGMARHILETPGDYVALSVESYDHHEWQVSRFGGNKTCANCGLLPLDDDDMETLCQSDTPAGWAVAFKAAE